MHQPGGFRITGRMESLPLQVSFFILPSLTPPDKGGVREKAYTCEFAGIE
jgi:hypothetical protein